VAFFVLVGGNKIFLIYGMSYDVIRNSIVPIDDFDIFQDGEIAPPTKQC
jgi:hypothetical protein